MKKVGNIKLNDKVKKGGALPLFGVAVIVLLLTVAVYFACTPSELRNGPE